MQASTAGAAAAAAAAGDDAGAAEQQRTAEAALVQQQLLTAAAVANIIAAARKELSALKPRALQKRAEEIGVSDSLLDDAADSEAIIDLILDATATGGGGAGGVRLGSCAFILGGGITHAHSTAQDLLNDCASDALSFSYRASAAAPGSAAGYRHIRCSAAGADCADGSVDGGCWCKLWRQCKGKQQQFQHLHQWRDCGSSASWGNVTGGACLETS